MGGMSENERDEIPRRALADMAVRDAERTAQKRAALEARRSWQV